MEATPTRATGLITLHAWRCWKCNQMLSRLALRPGSVVEIKCAKCGAFNTASESITMENGRDT